MCICMLLYRLKVLWQTGQENCVGPMRICDGVGIQYCPFVSLPIPMDAHPTAIAASSPSSSSSPSSCCWWLLPSAADANAAAPSWFSPLAAAAADSEGLGLGRPMCKATVTSPA
uniref:Uncharacterized protein n=1 Tax=Arundo donax TaxID=35708 RepID=A0A0A9DCX3_ARUDO